MAALVRHAGSALGQASGKPLDKQEVVSSSLLPSLQAFVAVLLSVAQVNILTRKLSKGARWEQYCWNPLLQENTSLVRLACMMKMKSILQLRWRACGETITMEMVAGILWIFLKSRLPQLVIDDLLITSRSLSLVSPG